MKLFRAMVPQYMIYVLWHSIGQDFATIWTISVFPNLSNKGDIVSSLKHDKYKPLMTDRTLVYLRDVNDHIQVKSMNHLDQHVQLCLLIDADALRNWIGTAGEDQYR